MKTTEFTYDLPDAAIAQVPIEPRDAARLLDTATMADHTVADLPALLEPGDLVVVNHTRVRPARLHGVKSETGGAVEALLLAPLGDDRWEALVRPARRLRPGVRLSFGPIDAEVVTAPEEGRAVLRLAGDDDIEAALRETGSVPLPPYIHTPLGDPERYQTVFARDPGSAAAPTAGLHLTESLLGRLRDRGVGFASVDLHIGVDTFRPIATDEVEGHRMHSEWTSVGVDTAEAVAATKDRGGRVVAVGTTVVRALETAAAATGAVAPFEGPTELFITPGYEFRAVDLLLTNFHVPGSTLVVLIAAFCGGRWRDVYATALERGYRFLSFGDAMLARRRP